MDTQFAAIVTSKSTAFVIYSGQALSLLKPFNGQPWFDMKGNNKKGLLRDKLFGDNWLQACYFDAFGDAPPKKLSGRQTFRTGGGHFLAYLDAYREPRNPEHVEGLKRALESKSRCFFLQRYDLYFF